jgi:hypothetical protein
MHEIMLNTGTDDSWEEVFTLLQIIITTPRTTAVPEKCFFLSSEKSKDFLKKHNITTPSFCFGHVKCGKK